jgi:hypothetical protein
MGTEDADTEGRWAWLVNTEGDAMPSLAVLKYGS